MEATEFIDLVRFFNQVYIFEEDITSNEQRANGQLVLKITYKYNDQTFVTQPLYYRSIAVIEGIHKKQETLNYFGTDVYWLDIEQHKWPQPAGKSDLDTIIIPDISDSANLEFVTFLKLLANNSKTGFIQKITEEGRHNQYHHNLENNNHWHDLVYLIKAYIDAKGQEIDKKYFSRLVFNWAGDKNSDRERATLTNKAFICSRYLIEVLRENILKIQANIMETEIIELLKQKKQIILQGPPGTGKTRQAKEIAKHLAKANLDLSQINDEFVQEYIKPGQKFYTTENSEFTVSNLVKSTVNLILQTGTTYPVTVEQIQKCLIEPVQAGVPRTYAKAMANYLVDQLAQKQYKLIQFHPAYSYEDFVRGISIKTENDKPVYYTENRTLGEWARIALDNYHRSKLAVDELSKEKWVERKLEEFVFFMQSDLDIKGPVKLTGSVSITNLDEDAFRYKGSNWDRESRINHKDFVRVAVHNLERMRDPEITKDLSVHAYFRKSYYNALLNLFFDHTGPYTPSSIPREPLRNYILIIDEINRANLPSVLGELIYALEYRGEPVTSLYKLENDQTLILPPNLYIIGTMNSADRSVSHIDYAIRRRFAFVEIIPSEKAIEEVIQAPALRDSALQLFRSVARLFTAESMAPDFKAKEVQLGHSYFLAASPDELKRKLEYEIKPILREYVKDGILLNEIEALIEQLSV